MLNFAMGMAIINTTVHMVTKNAVGPGLRADPQAAAM